ALFAFLVVLSIRYRRMWRFSLMLRCVAVAVMAHAAMLYGFYFWVVSTTIVALAERQEKRSEVTVERVLEARLSLEAARTEVVGLDVAPPRSDLSTEAPPPSARAEVDVALQDALALDAPAVEAFQPEGRTSPPPIEPVFEARLLLPELAIRPDAAEDLPEWSPEPARADPPTPLPGPDPAPLVKEADLPGASLPSPSSQKALRDAPPAPAAAMVVERAPGVSRLDAGTIIDAAATQVWAPAPAPAVLPPVARHAPGAPPVVTELPVPAQASEPSPERTVAAELVSPAVRTGQEPRAMAGAGPPAVRVTSASAGSAWRAQAAGILPTPETMASREVPEAFLAPPVGARVVPIAVRAPGSKLPEPEAVAEVESRSPESGTGPGVAPETRPPGASAPLSGKLSADVPSAAARPESRPITASSTASLAAASASVARLDVRPRPGLLQAAILPRAAPAIARATHTRLPEAEGDPADGGPEAADILTPGAPTVRAERAPLGAAALALAPPERVETAPVLTAAASLKAAPGPIRPPRAWTGASANPRTGPTSPEAPGAGPTGRLGAALLKLPESAPDPTPLGDLEHVRAPSTRRELLQRGGGTQGSEDAVRKSLEWLARHQSADGHWDVDGFDAACRGCQSPGFQVRCDAAITGLALLAFLGQGHTPKNPESPFQRNVAAAIEWLLRGQTPDGSLARDDQRYTMYTHGIATLALSEAAILCGDERMKEPLRRAARLIIDAQNPTTGGWRYKARPPIRGDTSITGWQVLALVSVRAAGIEVPEKAMDGARHWLDVEVAGGQHGGIYGYSRPDEPRVAMVAEGMFARLLLGAHRNDRNMEEAARYIHTETRGGGHLDNLYLLYYGNLALYHYQGWIWEAWNEEVRDFLLKSQIKSGPQAGSWDPTGPWSEAGGRVLSTSLAVLSLEVYYRYLPLYWTLEPAEK
ncbi:MAG TPA: hypothetical protein VMT52_13140, partial [Planctomycetota bacterium]|nr:hypothetical protein [Planctomycetota bacterium]